ncbi:hypothetical protein BC826DRAFT_968852 [Russula brevipes]|nr:hypothetical protein BC826DRAFT_968852 [Russula brevipes]
MTRIGSSITADYDTNTQGQRVLTNEEVYQGRPNTRLRDFPRGSKGNNRPYGFYAFCNNPERHINRQAFPVHRLTLFKGTWYEIRHDDTVNRPVLLKPHSYIHTYDDPTDEQIAQAYEAQLAAQAAEQAKDEPQEQPLDEEHEELEDNNQESQGDKTDSEPEDIVNLQIRNSPIALSNRSSDAPQWGTGGAVGAAGVVPRLWVRNPTLPFLNRVLTGPGQVWSAKIG